MFEIFSFIGLIVVVLVIARGISAFIDDFLDY